MSSNYNGIRESSKIIINSEHENLVPEISYSEFEGTELDPYKQMGVSGDTLEIYNATDTLVLCDYIIGLPANGNNFLKLQKGENKIYKFMFRKISGLAV